MAKLTHNLIWHFEAVNVRGEQKRFQCSKPISLEDWDTPREAAIWFTMSETVPSLDGWHLTQPKSIQVWNIVPLSDVAMA